MADIILPSPHEEVVVCLREHWIVMTKPFFAVIFTWVLFILLSHIAFSLASISVIAYNFLIIVGLIPLLVVHHRFFIGLIQWVISDWVITTKRIIIFENTPFIINDSTFINIHEIHEIEKRKHGVLPNLLNYGDVFINLAASPVSITLRLVSDPGKFVNLVESIRNDRLTEELDLITLQDIFRRKYQEYMEFSFL